MRIKEEFCRSASDSLSARPTTSAAPFQQVSVPQRNIRAAHWCATWNESTNSPIIGKAIYTAPTIFRFQHWIHVTAPTANTNTSLTPTSRPLQLRECDGCSLNNDVVGHRRNNAAYYLDQFPCRLSCSHDKALKLSINPTTIFNREATLTFNTSMARLSADIRISFEHMANP